VSHDGPPCPSGLSSIPETQKKAVNLLNGLTRSKKATVTKGKNSEIIGWLKWDKYLILFGGPCWNRTNNLLIKSQVLCLDELTALCSKHKQKKIGFAKT
jgi:hypothetical protein